MKKANILFADNDEEFLGSRTELLEQEGFMVYKAIDPTEAKNIFGQRNIDLAILDLRLLNDDDDKDFSGLNLAKQMAPSIPKIILTRYPTFEAVREALGSQLGDLPLAIGFVAKQEGPQVLLTAMRKALKLESLFQQVVNSLADRITDDYEDARKQAHVNFNASLLVALAGILIIFIGVGLSIVGMVAIGVPGIISGVILEAVGILFFKRADVANERMDRYHRELLEIRQFENLLAGCEELPTIEQKEICKVKVIEAAKERWLGHKKAQP
jgi:CheY-like chemotaxis protein